MLARPSRDHGRRCGAVEVTAPVVARRADRQQVLATQRANGQRKRCGWRMQGGAEQATLTSAVAHSGRTAAVTGEEPLAVLVYHGINTPVSPATLFRVQPSSGVPIYRQLFDQVLAMRASGRLAAGVFLPSVRQVAEDLAVNPMTVSKAWSLLERDGVVELVRGQGMRVAAPRAMANQAQRLAELRPLLEQVVANAHQLSLPRRAVLELLDHLLPKDQP